MREQQLIALSSRSRRREPPSDMRFTSAKDSDCRRFQDKAALLGTHAKLSPTKTYLWFKKKLYGQLICVDNPHPSVVTLQGWGVCQSIGHPRNASHLLFAAKSNHAACCWELPQSWRSSKKIQIWRSLALLFTFSLFIWGIYIRHAFQGLKTL